jgi:hypothetical protein
MTTAFCEYPSTYDEIIMPSQLEAPTTTVVQETTWHGNLFEAGSSYLTTTLTSAQAMLLSVPWYGWTLIAFALFAVLAQVRPRKTTHVTNHYHRRSRPQFARRK